MAALPFQTLVNDFIITSNPRLLELVLMEDLLKVKPLFQLKLLALNKPICVRSALDFPLQSYMTF